MSVGGHVIRVEREMINFDYMSDIDANWKYTDKAGHRHYCDYDGSVHYPTLAVIQDGTWWCEDCGDEHEDSHLACLQCGERITPGTTGPGRKWIPGRVNATIDGEPATMDEIQALIRENTQ